MNWLSCLYLYNSLFTKTVSNLPLLHRCFPDAFHIFFSSVARHRIAASYVKSQMLFPVIDIFMDAMSRKLVLRALIRVKL